MGYLGFAIFALVYLGANWFTCRLLARIERNTSSTHGSRRSGWPGAIHWRTW